MDWFEREVQWLELMLDNGEISQTEFNKEMRALEREYADNAYCAAREAYDNELDNWFA